MKRHHYVTVILSFVMALLILPTTTLAATTVKFKGNTADAYFYSSDGECIHTNVGVFVTEDIAKQGGAKSFAYLFIDQYNSCEEEYILLASGETLLDAAAFQSTDSLNSATLNTTFELLDAVSSTSMAVNVNLSWTGIGPVSNGKSNSHFETEGCKYHSKFNGTFRSAVASGSVLVGETHVTPDSSLSAGLQSAKSGDTIFGCGL